MMKYETIQLDIRILTHNYITALIIPNMISKNVLIKAECLQAILQMPKRTLQNFWYNFVYSTFNIHTNID